MVDYYTLLNIEQDDTKEEIKKAYHKAALKYHPDKNKEDNAETMFKQVVEAYEVLIDPVKKQKYDFSLRNRSSFDFKLSPEILKFSRFFFSDENIDRFSNFSNAITKEISNLNLPPYFDTIFNSFTQNIRNNTMRNLVTEYNEFKKFYKINDEKYKKSSYNCNDNCNKCDEDSSNMGDKNEDLKLPKNISFNLLVELEDIYQKIVKNIAIKMNVKCKKCEGTGIMSITKVKKKKHTKNKKKKKVTYVDKRVCDVCNGLMGQKERKIYIIECSQDQIIFRNEFFIDDNIGHGDLVINIITKPNKVKRSGRYDLMIERNISLYEFYFGGDLRIEHIDNTIINEKIPKLMNETDGRLVSERDINIENYGLSIYDNGLKVGRGNLIVRLKIVLPSNLDEFEMDIKKIFGNINDINTGK